MNNILQKPRSPYTRSGFNYEPLANNNKEVNMDILDSLPLLSDVVKNLQIKQRNSIHGKRATSFVGEPFNHMPQGAFSESGKNIFPNEEESPPTRATYSQDNYEPSNDNSELGEFGQLGDIQTMSSSPTKATSDTDSESEYFRHLTDYEAPVNISYWHRCMNRLQLKQQRIQVSSIGHRLLLLLLQFINCVVTYGRRHGSFISQLGFNTWPYKYQMRSVLREMLWCMANAKSHDILFFFVSILLTPWLYLISMVGLIVSVALVVKEALSISFAVLRERYTNANMRY